MSADAGTTPSLRQHDWIVYQRSVETARSKQARARARAAQAAGGTDPIPEPKTYTPKSIAEATR